GNIMIIHDISMSINPSMTVYKNRDNKRPELINAASFEKEGVFETKLSMNLHTGTHIDFPLHTIQNGVNSNQYELETFLGIAKVFDLLHVNDHISESDLLPLDIKENDFVLFKTKNSESESFDFEFIYVDLSAAKYLSKKKIRGVGIDSLGIERNQANHPTHDTLLSQNIVILEGLRLNNISAKTYDFICLPLKIDAVEALPVRAILIENDVNQ
ncbi:MAG: cyclase, partial [Tenericutes bacterium HGW-Tenericutes-2]